MHVPAKVYEFLRARSGRAYCDQCIQERMGLKWRQHVQQITLTLGVTESFTRGIGTCSNCNHDKQVISANMPAREPQYTRPSARFTAESLRTPLRVSIP